MNVIYINTHDSGRVLSPYGYDIPTDNLKELAKDGSGADLMYNSAKTTNDEEVIVFQGKHVCYWINGNGHWTGKCSRCPPGATAEIYLC